eukprot:Ihof_evm3s332 gene=Ihof_evmTU3s332
MTDQITQPIKGTHAPKVLLIDNYDSFTFNIYQYLRELGAEVIVHRNDAITLEECQALQPTHVVISPGPGHPLTDSNLSRPVIELFGGKVPVFGVCMGMQCMYALYGGQVIGAPTMVHGKVSIIHHDSKGCFTDLPPTVKVTRYHSLVGDPSDVPKDLEVTATTADGVIMGVRHKRYTVEGVQFHPESILTEYGYDMFRNFLSLTSGVWNKVEIKPILKGPSTPTAIQTAIKLLCNDKEPMEVDMIQAFDDIMTGHATDAQTATLLMAVKSHGETPTIVNSCCAAVLNTSVKCDLPYRTVDIVGTGGDMHNTFNVSTTAGLVAAAAGLRVAKHGNRSSSSKCGSSDLLEELGVQINTPPNNCGDIIDRVGYCFLFAQLFHPAMKTVAAIRKQMGVRTIFNIIGPLINPTNPRAMIVGVYTPKIGKLMAETLRLRGIKEGMVVCGAEGLDEISISGPTYIWRLHNDEVKESVINPSDFGLPCHPIETVVGGDPATNASILLSLLDGMEGPFMDFVLINTS